MQLHDLKEKAEPKQETKRRIGRGDGSGKGTYCGRGVKGQKAREGWSTNPYFEGGKTPLIRQIPKHGFNNSDFRSTYAICNVRELNRYDDGTELTPDKLIEDGVVRPQKDEQDVKILGGGSLEVELEVRAHAFSDGARDKIEEAGGEAVEVEKQEA